MKDRLLPVSMAEAGERGWDEIDFVCVTGDAYVDHPSFGIAIISRLLESEGYRVGVISQPGLKNADIERFGRPKAFWVTAGNIDSMVAHYTAAKKRRSDDDYTPGGRAGKRPDRAAIAYTRLIRERFGDLPVIIGGLEASLRRFAHYDYWDDAVRPSVLCDSGADLLVFGMGERQTREIARGIFEGKALSELRGTRGICYLGGLSDIPGAHLSVASFEKVAADKLAYIKTAKSLQEEQDSVTGRHIVQKHGDRLLIQTPPAAPLGENELDAVFALPFTGRYHPSYEALGGVKAIEEVEFSIMHNRGCFGSCNFCAITFHQGRVVTSRSHRSVLEEAERLAQKPSFKGYIHDVGGPTANFRAPACSKQLKTGACKDRRCLAPAKCPNLSVDHGDYLELLRKVRAVKGIKKVFVRSGLRFDYINADRDRAFLEELVRHHISGQLKVAPEHCSPPVLKYMGKAPIGEYEKFAADFYKTTKKAGKEQYLVPYLMSSHPGCRLGDAVALALFLKKHNIRPEQVQDFYPTPGTLSTAMFYTGLEPDGLKPIYVAKTDEEKRLQRALLQYFRPENREAVIKALELAGRTDLIGSSPACLVPPPAAARKPLVFLPPERRAVAGRPKHSKKPPRKNSRGGRA